MRRDTTEFCTIDVDIVAVTDEAILIDDGDTETWLPLSQVFNKDKFNFEKGDNVELAVAYWIAKRKGLI
jgi:hypothetical protein